MYSMVNANNLLRLLDLKIPDFKYQRYSSNYNEVNRSCHLVKGILKVLCSVPEVFSKKM